MVTIIVGIATVVAINTFGTAADQANVDAVRNDVATLASAAQGFYMRPGMLGGGSRTFTGLSFDGLAFPADGVTATPLTAQNENGRYTIAVLAPQSFSIVADPASCDGYTPGAVDAEGVLTGGTACAAADQITATVEPNVFAFDS
ncbi:hypothetical protein [Rhodohalobacter sp. 8-1]|uniref:hypothetical protein n=1 Tax=Rhodohalobacter sp. 8-1 TaxID=3131972 RepID=UPI0030EE5FC6